MLTPALPITRTDIAPGFSPPFDDAQSLSATRCTRCRRQGSFSGSGVVTPSSKELKPQQTMTVVLHELCSISNMQCSCRLQHIGALVNNLIPDGSKLLYLRGIAQVGRWL